MRKEKINSEGEKWQEPARAQLQSWEVVCEERETEAEKKEKGNGRRGRRGGEVRNPQPETIDS